MTTTSGTDSIEATTALLQAELPRLEEHQQALQKELAVVSERVESVRSALSALSALAATSLPRPRAAEPQGDALTVETAAAPGTSEVQEPAQAPAPAPAEESAPVAGSAAAAVPDAEVAQGTPPKPRKATGRARKKAAPKAATPQASTRRPAKKRSTKTGQSKQAAAPRKKAEAAVQDTGGLTEQVIAVLSKRADTPLRARDVAAALGRDESAGAINTVRSTLDRLVATSRAHRAGRGLYQAPTG
ncbi:hypothetical protein J7E88_09800 [Streptomyces sp. ISL-10]|uniref:hypothetical protein n=1 Tax=Streptomyces sp. ISL-10 TaxID=2819172 RepID=UPI001BEC2474|nr:hypothetical protein [Streptomyces sp. ISL-10]MBT2365605.1 hypothetical protein [Streptomyces sp. ISL-10]